MSKILYSIVVPVYKSARSLTELSDRTCQVFNDMNDSDYEIIFVNDSPQYQETKNVLEQLAKNEKIIVIELMKNSGQQQATLCGIKHAHGDYVITMDDDLQHAPEDIPSLISQSVHDVVIAKFKDIKHSYFKRFTSNIKGYFDHLILGKPKHLKLTSFRLIKKEVADFMFLRKTPYPFIPALLFSITDDIVNVSIDHFPRVDGKSNYTIIKMVQVFSNLLINNSSLLLRFIGYIGIFISMVASLFALAILLENFFWGGASIAGWTSIFLMVIFFGGMTLFTLGVIGEYLVRIIATTEERPIYHIRKVDDDRKV
jgi:glycosyltransferase involved in cell wall biosynthesis